MKTTNILTSLFFIYLLCFQNALYAANVSKKIGSNSKLKQNKNSNSTILKNNLKDNSNSKIILI